MTSDGLPCHPWNGKYSAISKYTGVSYATNHCRNPNGRKRPWCITAEDTSDWGYCNVHKCKFNMKSANYPLGGKFINYVHLFFTLNLPICITVT